ncbi:hypothetical protein ABW21_db0204639 [Orbilia brochopaga]|nr:hypothetical protein ABW21_db0204639 [Drechslerella brochopaga]
MTPDEDLPPPAGTRFTVDFDDEPINHDDRPIQPVGLIADVAERTVSSPAIAPSLPANSTAGFPAHTKRKRPSAFRQRVAASNPAAASTSSTSNVPAASITAHDDISSIRAENARTVAGMSAAQVAHERQELVDSLSPELLQMFLKRASLDEPVETSRPVTLPSHIPTSTSKSTSTSTSQDTSTSTSTATPTNLAEIQDALPPPVSIHFPAPPNPTEDSDPDPDPSSPTFLSHLHKKYFPTLPTDPQKLAWMHPPTANDSADTYSPSLSAILPSAIRFDFRGRLLPPRKAREVPGHLGLHHHADAPLSAGYTVPELAHLARSSFPAQRCMAFQTLGRILYRLGSGAYSTPTTNNTSSTTDTDNDTNTNTDNGNNSNDISSEEVEQKTRRIATDLERGLWRCIHEGRVLESLQDAAGDGTTRTGSTHLGVRNYALEALWLWQKGGGERWKAD